MDRIAGIFRPAKVSCVFSFCNEQERKLDAQFFRQNGRGLLVIRKNGIKTDEIQSINKKKQKNFGPTKYTRYAVVILVQQQYYITFYNDIHIALNSCGFSLNMTLGKVV